MIFGLGRMVMSHNSLSGLSLERGLSSFFTGHALFVTKSFSSAWESDSSQCHPCVGGSNSVSAPAWALSMSNSDSASVPAPAWAQSMSMSGSATVSAPAWA